MTTWHAIVLGIVQGLTEFLPISSSGHLIIVPWLLGWDESGLTFDVALHLGTLTAVVAYFWRDLVGMAIALPRGIVQRRPLGDPMSRLALIIIIGSIPAAIFGAIFNDQVDSYFHSGGGGNRAIVEIALLLIALGFVLLLAERLALHRRSMKQIDARDGLFIGAAQALALLPGVSRSGSTITAGLFAGLQREAAARFSFLLGVPAIVGAGLLEARKLMDAGLPDDERKHFIVGVVTAAIVGYLTIAFLLRYLHRNSTMVFVIYRFAVGALILSLVVSGFR
jgi:undecaprenyl-diphosphatase